MKPLVIHVLAIVIALNIALCAAGQSGPQSDRQSDEGKHVLALDNSWNRALETNDTRALDLLLADSFVSIDIDGSIQTKSEFLDSLKAPGYEPPTQSVTEQSKVEVYGDSAIVVGVFRTQSGRKSRSVTRRERFLDTWVNINHTWKCVASVAVLIPAH